MILGLGGGEVILVLFLLIILCLDKIIKGFLAMIDREGKEVGKSLGAIYGKPAAEALTPENQVAELYDPYVLRKGENERSKRGRFFFWPRLRQWVRRLLRKISRRS